MAARERAAPSASAFWSASRGFWVVWVVHLGRRYGLLAALASAKRPLPVSALARKGHCHEAAARSWCKAAEALRLVRTSKSGVTLPRHLVPLLLSEEDPRYLGGHLSYLALRSLDFDAFDHWVRYGSTSARPQRYLLEAFAEATRFDHTAFLEVLLPRIPRLRGALARGCEVLDVGAGAGAWESRVAPKFPRSRFVGLDPDAAAVRLAQRQAARDDLEGRVEFLRGSAESMQFRERFDVAYLGEMLCAGNDPLRVLRQCRKALRPGGWLVVCEGLVDEDKPPTAPGNDLVLPMQLEFALQPARFLGKRELSVLLRRAGFKRPSFVPAGCGLYFAVAQR
jgi:SAM-dependent methyltransferase